MKAYLIYLLIIPLIFKGDLLSQNNKYDKELSLLIIKNQQFDTLISNAICCLKKCDYYSKAIVFSVIIGKKNDSTYVDLAANHDLGTTLIFERHWKLYGYFFFNGHLFVVFYDNLPNMFFEVAKTKKEFVINTDVSPVSDYTEWLYFYKDDRFVLKKVINKCDKEEK